MTSVSMPRSSSSACRFDEPWMSALKRCLSTTRSRSSTSSCAHRRWPARVAFDRAERRRAVAPAVDRQECRPCRGELVGLERHPDPRHGAARVAHRRGEPIDVRHDVARRRHLERRARLDEEVLHVDDHERRASTRSSSWTTRRSPRTSAMAATTSADRSGSRTPPSSVTRHPRRRFRCPVRRRRDVLTGTPSVSRESRPTYVQMYGVRTTLGI